MILEIVCGPHWFDIEVALSLRDAMHSLRETVHSLRGTVAFLNPDEVLMKARWLNTSRWHEMGTHRTVVLSLLLGGMAVLCWPGKPLGRRGPHFSGPHAGNAGATLHTGSRPPRTGGALVAIPPSLLALAVGGGVAIWGSIPVALAAFMAAGSASTLIRSATQQAEISRGRIETIDAVRVLARELRSGSSVPTACDAAAGAAGSRAAPLISALGIAAKVGSNTLLAAPRRPQIDDGVMTALNAAWSLSRKHGIPLAALVEGAAEDLARSAAAEGRQNALLAGPRLSGYLLSALPLLGILLGAGMGANPIPVLFGDGIGSILLMVGALLTCLGLLWSARIAR